MQSVLAITYEIDDSAAAALDIAEQVRQKGPLATNSCGILFAETGFEIPELLTELQKALGITIIGATATAQISSQGYHRISATLLVLTADDCHFSVAASGPLQEDYATEITEAFNKAAAGLKGEPWQAVFIFSSPSAIHTADDYMAVLNPLAKGKPIFGATASDYFEFSNELVFLNQEALSGSMVIMLISGNIKPRFIIRNIPRTGLPKSVVTKASGCNVETIDNMTVYEFMKKNDVDVDNDELSLYYAPLSVDYANEVDNDGQPVCRPFYSINKETGAAISHGQVPQGAKVSIRTITAKDIEESFRDALATLLQECRDAGDNISTILGVTCAVRHMVLALGYQKEGEIAQELIPPGVNFSAFYSYGEFCPTSVRQGIAKNRCHNMSIGLCSF